ncbi:hypothetical protein AB1Y20_023143 [Prymnesium parvum]|uniref:TerB family tellurite resistance protein n=1 Tax=Prymnesium parvum TaxID=97485 RepID=A0AB34JEL0_PRYPA
MAPSRLPGASASLLAGAVVGWRLGILIGHSLAMPCTAHSLDFVLLGALLGFAVARQPLGSSLAALLSASSPLPEAQAPAERPLLPPEARSGTSLYKQRRGVRYDRSILDLADWLGRAGRALDLNDVFWLWSTACDGPGVTETERSTLRHVLETHSVQPAAKEELLKHIEESERSAAAVGS